MEEGFLVEQHEATAFYTEWQSGTPEYSFFFGLLTGHLKHRQPRLEVTTYRCTGCGLLKSYALG